MSRKLKKAAFSILFFLFTTVIVNAQTNLQPGITISLQAENTTFTQAEVETEHNGFTGSGYINFENTPGGYIEWTVSTSSAGTADCVFYFANGGSNRSIEIRINGNIAVENHSFSNTGSWDTWSTEQFPIGLMKGTNKIRLTGTGSDGGPNFDKMDITLLNGNNTGTGGGDVNDDGFVDIVDALLIAQNYVGLNPNPFNMSHSDANCDGSTDIVDALLVAQNYVGLINTISPCNNNAATPIPTLSAPPITPTPEVLNEIYISPNGRSGASGTLADPLPLIDAIKQIGPGGTIWARGGTYSYSKTILIAEGNDGKKLYAYASEKPVIDFSAMSFNSSNRGIILAGSHWHIRGITIQKAGDNGMLLAGNNNTLEDCIFSQNRDSGLQLSRYNTNYNSINQWPSNNLILRCISRDNYDTDDGEDADGYAPKLTCGTGNIFRDSKALYNCDDGIDCYTKSSTGPIGAIRFEGVEASNNGKTSTGLSGSGSDGNGFKLGDDSAAVRHVLINCVANNNKKCGYTGNGNPGPITLTNCTGRGNGQTLFDRL